MEILLVDDHALFRDGLTLVLEKIEQDVKVYQANDAKTAIATAEQYPDLDLVLLDYNIPGNTHFETLTTLKHNLPATPVAMLSAEENAGLIQEGLQAGASGFVTKSSNAQVMLSAIQLILSGGLYVPPAILNTSPSDKSTSAPIAANTNEADTPPSPIASANTISQNPQAALIVESSNDVAAHNILQEEDLKLTGRQKEVLFYMDKGMSNKEIAKYLEMSPSTVKVHVAGILRVVHASNRTQAVSSARQLGLIPKPEDLP